MSKIPSVLGVILLLILGTHLVLSQNAMSFFITSSGPGDAKGVRIAENVADLHGDKNNLTKQTALTEKGEVVNGRGDQPNRHDILTGSQLDGTVLAGDPPNTTCGNWTSDGEGSAQVGHHDRQGGGDNPTSWNSAHPSRGCSQENLRGTGGDGLFYCFAIN
jgi:hypothetical protein